MRSLQEIDRDIAAMRKDEQAYAHTKGHRFSPIVDDELDDLYAERMATLKALGDAGLKKYKALILPKPENKNSVCAACYAFYAKDSTQAYEPNLPGMVWLLRTSMQSTTSLLPAARM